jgi:hypothetical protein
VCCCCACEHGLAAADPRLPRTVGAEQCAGNAEAFSWPGLPAPRRRTETAGGAYAASEGVGSAAVALSNLEPSSLQWRAGSCGKADRAVARTETWTSETRDRGGRVAVAVAVAEAVTEGKYGSSSCTFEESRSGGENALEGTSNPDA